MAVVYRAIQLNLQRPVALKVLSQELARSEEFVGRFFNEARSAAALSHANIIQAYDAGLAGDSIYYFAMEYVEGETVEDRIQRDGPIPVRTALRMATDIADALDYGWQRQKLTHGDIKPDNIMVNTDGETKLADFGLAKVAEHDFAGSDIMLTPLYAAPEAIRGELQKGDCRGDIYSFGATLYHMIAGRPPFPGRDTNEVLERHLNETAPPLSKLARDLPAGVSEFVSQLLEKDPAERPQDWRAVLKELRQLGRGHGRSPAATGKRLKVSRDAVRQASAHAKPTAKSSLLVPFMIIAAFLAVAVALFVVLHGRTQGNAQPAPTPSTGTSAPDSGAAPTKIVDNTAPAKGGAQQDQLAQERIQKLWEGLQTRLREFDGDPAKCVGALEAFQAEHRDTWLPPDFAVRLKDYRDAAKWNTEGSTTKPEETVETTTKEPQPAPAKADPRSLPQTEEQQRDDAFTRLMADIRALQYRPGASVEPLVREAKAWLTAYPGESDRKLLVDLIAGDFLPGLDECIPKLIANKQALVGKPVLDSKGVERRVQDITLESVAADEKTPHGTLRVRLHWASMKDLRPILALCFHAFGGKGTTVRDRQCLLALALVSQDDGWWRTATKGLTVSPRLRYWQSLREEYGKANEEGKALDLWVELRKIFASGTEDSKAYHLARQLEGSRTDVAQRHQAQLAQIQEISSEAIPGIKAGRMVREAQAQLKSAPFECLQILNLVQARYGMADFPEKRQLDALRFQALAALPRPEQLLRTMDNYPHYCFCTQALGTWGSPPHIAMISFQDLSRQNPPSPRFEPLQNYARMIALTELGDWAMASAQLAQCPLDNLPVAIPEFTGCAAFAAGLLGDRYPAKALKTDAMAVIRAAIAMPQARAEVKVQLAALLCDYALVTHRCDEPRSEVILADTVDSVMSPAGKTAYALAAMTVDLEAGRTEEAGKMLTDFGTSVESRNAYRFTSINGELLLALGKFVADGTMVAPDQLELPFADYEHFLRLAVSALCSNADQAGAAAEAIAKGLPSHLIGLGPVGGSAVYDLALLRIACALRNKDMDQARSVADWALAQTCTALFPYYPRLLLIKAGLSRLAGEPPNQQTIRGLILSSTVANSAERGLTPMLDPDYNRNQIRRTVPRLPGRNVRFWYEWLEATIVLPKTPAEKRARLAASIFNRQCRPAERLLTPALAKYYQQ
jgi:hypothetical protein